MLGSISSKAIKKKEPNIPGPGQQWVAVGTWHSVAAVSVQLFVVVSNDRGNVAVCSPQLLITQLWTAHTGNWELNTVHRDVEFGPETSPLGDLVSDSSLPIYDSLGDIATGSHTPPSKGQYALALVSMAPDCLLHPLALSRGCCCPCLLTQDRDS